MKVLIGVDGSENSLQTVRFIGRLLSAERDQVLLYHSPPPIHLRGGRQMDPDVLQRAQNVLAEPVLEKALHALPVELRDQTESLTGIKKAAHGLLVAADKHRADLIVVGAKGIGTLRGILLGSVSRSIAHTATVPVLVVRHSDDQQEASSLNVLLACAHDESSRDIANVIDKLSWPQRSTGQVITVVESLLAGKVPKWLEQQARETADEEVAHAWVEQHDEEIKHRHEELLGYCQDLPSIFQDRQPLVVEGNPPQEILDAIKQNNTDLVVTGARELGPLGRLLLGSTSEHLLTHAPCSVLIVRQHETP